MTKDLSALRSTIEELTKENESLAQANKLFENDEPRLRSTIERLEKERDEAGVLLATCRQQLEIRERLGNKASADRDQLAARVKEQNERIRWGVSALKIHQSEIEVLRSQLRTAQETNKRLETDRNIYRRYWASREP